jgi:outer membrane lipoprotein SlyB
MRKLGILAAVTAAAALSGCASIFSGPQQKVSFASTPSDARVTVTDRLGNVVHAGVTPYEVKLKRGAGFMRPQRYSVRFEKDGFAAKEVNLVSGANGWVFGNLVIGGVLGVLIDGGTGAMFAMSPSELSVPLEAQTVTVSVVDVSRLTPAERARLTPIG